MFLADRQHWLIAHAVAHWRFKLVVSLFVLPLTLVPYLLLQRYRLFEPRAYELLWIDELAGFKPDWVWVYITYYALICLPFLLTTQRSELWRFLIGWYAVAAAAWVVFLFYPVDGPRPTPTGDEPVAYRLLVAIDTPGNAMPSLHLGLLVYAMLFAHRTLDASVSRRSRRLTLAAGWLWCAVVGWSTLATKQHYFIDALAGAALAAAVMFVVVRLPLPTDRQEEDRPSNGS